MRRSQIMSFEVKERDLAGRTGTFYTRRGKVETPCLMPVVNPLRNCIPPSELKDKFGFSMIITNAYLILKHIGTGAGDVHQITGFEGPIMTDSGAYQLLIYGGVDTDPEEIIRFQERIRSDIGVILDTPTGGFASREEAERTVRETVRRAEASIGYREDETMLWAGPIQGGRHLDLVEESARRMGALDYDLHPLGSPVQIMEEYDYAPLVDMIVTAKKVLPPERPLHLFGAGHPMILPLAVALGCDLFDSAAYALFAKDDRYMMPSRTIRLEDMTELPCCCPVCSSTDLEGLKGLPKVQREVTIARHNLYVTMQEMKVIKQSIREGSLWELVEGRCRSHPRLYDAFRRLREHKAYLEKGDPVIGKKVRGVFIYDAISLNRPEVFRHRSRIIGRYVRPPAREIGVFVPNPPEKPFIRSSAHSDLSKLLKGGKVHVCYYGPPFGVVPSELSETFPLSQYESSDLECDIDSRLLEEFIRRNKYRRAIVVDPTGLVRIKGASVVKTIQDVEIAEEAPR